MKFFQVWNVEQGNEIASWHTQSGYDLNGVLFSSDGEQVITLQGNRIMVCKAIHHCLVRCLLLNKY